MPRFSTCRACGAAIIWTVTEARKRLAVDATPDPGGNTAVSRDGRGTWLSRRPTTGLPLAPYERLHMPHVATCATTGEPEPDLTRCLGLLRLEDQDDAR